MEERETASSQRRDEKLEGASAEFSPRVTDRAKPWAVLDESDVPNFVFFPAPDDGVVAPVVDEAALDAEVFDDDAEARETDLDAVDAA